MAKNDMNPRTCIVTREENEPDNLIRFVKDPQGNVVPDLKRKLPGRGVWVGVNKILVEQAVKKGLFNKGFQEKVVASSGLPEMIEGLLKASALSALAMAKKAGLVVPGQTNAELAIKNGASDLAIIASDAAPNGLSKMSFAIKSREPDENVEMFELFTGDELDEAIGGVNVKHIAILNGGLAGKLTQNLKRCMQYKGNEN